MTTSHFAHDLNYDTFAAIQNFAIHGKASKATALTVDRGEIRNWPDAPDGMPVTREPQPWMAQVRCAMTAPCTASAMLCSNSSACNAL